VSAPPCSRVRVSWIILAVWAAGGVCLPEETRAQGTGTMLDRPARLDVRDVPLEKALVLLQRASGVALAYSPDLVPDERRVSCPCKEMTVSQALDRLLKGTGLRYRLGDDNVVIGRWKPASNDPTRL
jgi:hypothetical protein